jgi:hypothetical protein
MCYYAVTQQGINDMGYLISMALGTIVVYLACEMAEVDFALYMIAMYSAISNLGHVNNLPAFNWKFFQARS